MKKALIFAGGLFALLASCATGNTAKGTTTTINTLGGDSLDAIELVANIFGHERVRIARDSGGSLIVYADVKTVGQRAGSLLMTIDGERHTIIPTSGWSLTHVNGSTRDYSGMAFLSSEIVTGLMKAETVVLRSVVNWGGTAMSEGDGADISMLLPQLKEFLAK